MASGYIVAFADGECVIKDKDACTLLARVQMTAHRLFPLEANDVGSANAALSQHEVSKLWHRRYGHLNNIRLQQLSQKKLVLGLPHILPTGVTPRLTVRHGTTAALIQVG